MKKQLLKLLFSAFYLVSCHNNSYEEGLKDYLNIESVENANPTITSPSPSPSSGTNNAEGCNFISWYDPSTNKNTLQNSIQCWNSKPKWWPNLNPTPTPLPSWYIESIPNPGPNEFPQLVNLQTRAAAILLCNKAIKNNLEVQRDVLTDTTGFDPLEYYGLSEEEIEFLDNHFALQNLLLDERYSFYPINGTLNTDELGMAELYTLFKDMETTYVMQDNFFGLGDTTNYVYALQMLPFSFNYSNVIQNTDCTSHYLQFFSDQLNLYSVNKVRFPRYYFYFFAYYNGEYQG